MWFEDIERRSSSSPLRATGKRSERLCWVICSALCVMRSTGNSARRTSTKPPATAAATANGNPTESISSTRRSVASTGRCGRPHLDPVARAIAAVGVVSGHQQRALGDGDLARGRSAGGGRRKRSRLKALLPGRTGGIDHGAVGARDADEAVVGLRANTGPRPGCPAGPRRGGRCEPPACRRSAARGAPGCRGRSPRGSAAGRSG